VNEYTPDIFRGLAMLCLAAWIVVSLLRRSRRLGIALAFVGISLTLGPGFVTWAVKEHTLRARPFDVVQFGGERQFTPALTPAQQCTDNCAFTSGHVACGFFFVSLMLLDPRRRWRWIAAGLTAGTLVAVARMSVGAHWLSDALWALPITLGTSGLVWLVLGFFYKYGQPAAAQEVRA
jgi:lipid A 4'-phosphatase